MKNKHGFSAALPVIALLLGLIVSSNIYAQNSEKFLGIDLRPDIRTMIAEIEKGSNNKIYARFTAQPNFAFGGSYISESGVPNILVDNDLKNEPEKLEAVIVHELLHLRLRVRGYPVFQFSPTVNTAEGRAIDVAQDFINDLNSLIEHRIFKPDMEKFGLYKVINLAGDTAKNARMNKNQKDGQADVINYARAILEYQNAADVEEVRKVYAANVWTRALREGKAVADIISTSDMATPKTVETVFLKCLAQLYPLPRSDYNFTLTPDAAGKFGRRMIINIARRTTQKRARSRRN